MNKLLKVITILISLLFLSCCVPNHLAPTIRSFELHTPRSSMNIKVQVDNRFDQQEQLKIEHALQRITFVSEGLINYEVQWDVEEPGIFKDVYKTREDGILYIWRLQNNSTNFTPNQMKEYDNLYGFYYYGPNESDEIVILADYIPPAYFEGVVIHENIHALHGSHVNQNLHSIMTPRYSQSCIGSGDSEQLCWLVPGCVEFKAEKDCD